MVRVFPYYHGNLFLKKNKNTRKRFLNALIAKEISKCEDSDYSYITISLKVNLSNFLFKLFSA